MLCGRESIFVSMAALALGVGQFYIFLVYSRFKFRFIRDGVWVFFALGILSWLLVLSFVVRTCTSIQQNDKKEKEEKKPAKIAVMCDTAITRFNDLIGINGKYHLAKMYVSQLVMHIQQVPNLKQYHLCRMPVGASTTLCAVLTVELLNNIWVTFHIGSQEMRDRLMLIDILTDIFCMAFPLLYTWIGFYLPSRVTPMLFVVVWPTLSSYSKLNDIWEDYFKMDLERIERTKKATRSRRRKSILKLSHNRDTFNTQLEYFPKWLRYVFTALNIGFVLFFVSVVSVQLATQPSTDTCSDIFTKEVWEGCKVPAPFCQELFVAKCDCAVVEMINYTKKALPESFGNLTSLVKLGVYTGQLEDLPEQIGDNHKKLLVLRVIDNQLKSLPESVGKLQNLLDLRVFGNQLKSLPNSVGNLQNLFALYVFRNQLKSLPDSVGKLQNLLDLRVFNNQLKSLPGSVGNLHRLMRLYVFNNQLKSLPDSVGNLQKLITFYAWNNTLAALPKTIGNMKSLIAVDVRHNSLRNLPSSASQWSNIEYLYLTGNPMCANLNIPSNLEGAIGLCEQQCSADCPGIFLGNGKCNDLHFIYATVAANRFPIYLKKPKPNSGCNTAACEYDKGDCPR